MTSTQTQLPTNYREAFDITVSNMTSNPKYVDYLFYLHMLAQCKIIFDPTMQAPAGVNFQLDHYNLYINPLVAIPIEPDKDGNYPKDKKGNDITSVPGFSGFPLEQRMGILKHEMLHILNSHWTRRQDRNHEGFNIAADCAINQQIERSHLPAECIFPDQFPSHDGKSVPDNLSAEQYYELLKFDKDGSGHGGMASNQPGSPGSTLDDHSKWDDSTGDADLAEDIAKSMTEKAINQTQKSRGTVPSQIAQWLDNLTKKREVDWRQVLRRLAGNKRAYTKRTLMRRDRRLPDLAHIKGKTKARIGTIVIVGDESGSVSDHELTQAIGESLHICKTLNTPLWYVPVDSQAHKPHQLKSSQRTFKRTACGGTVLAPAINMIHSNHLEYNALVIITDGGICHSDIDAYASLHKPIIWLITSHGDLLPEMQSGHMRAFKLKDK